MNAATISTTRNEATAWHAIAADDVARRLNTNTATGLDAAEIPKRLAKYGRNRLQEVARHRLRPQGHPEKRGPDGVQVL
jgi:hypothetical protein